MSDSMSMSMNMLSDIAGSMSSLASSSMSLASSMSMPMSSMSMSSLASSSMSMASSMSMPMSSMSMSSSMAMPTSTLYSSSSMSMDLSTSSIASSSSSMEMPSSTLTSSYMSATMSSMNMAASSSMNMNMSGMNMGTSTTGSSSSMSTGTPDMGGDMGDMDMGMNSYLTPTYKNYPVLFHKLSADSKGKAFGIFLLIVVAAFVYKLTLFVSWCLEVKWFKKWNKHHKGPTSATGGMDYYNEDPLTSTHLPKVPTFAFQIFKPSSIDLAHDFVRVILTFISTMLIYMLMLAAMSFVLTYVFAVITGLALAEVFFNRCKICMLERWEIQAAITRAKSGNDDCQCNPDDNRLGSRSSNDPSMSNEKSSNFVNDQEAPCCCTDNAIAREKEVENNALENSRLQEQAGNMDPNLLPAEKLR